MPVPRTFLVRGGDRGRASARIGAMAALAYVVTSLALVAPPPVWIHHVKRNVNVCMIDPLTVAEGAAGISLGVGLIRRVMAEKETEELTQAAATTSPVTGQSGSADSDVHEKVSEPMVAPDNFGELAPAIVRPLPPSGFAWAEDMDGQHPAPVVEPQTSVAVASSSERLPTVSQEQGATLRSPEEWPSLGGSGAWHPMRGPWPKRAAREQWVPPAGWKPPTKPVLSWYDRGVRLPPSPSVVRSWYDSGNRLALGDEVASVLPAAEAVMDTPEAAMMREAAAIAAAEEKAAAIKATAMAQQLGTKADAAFAETVAASTVAFMSAADATTYLSGAATRTSLVAKGVSLTTINAALREIRRDRARPGETRRDPSPAAPPPTWPSLGGSGAWHPMRGPWPKRAAREQWVPPAGWKPPTKPVLSWYDSGVRLPPSPSGVSSRVAEPVASWYDSGVRLPPSPSAPPSSPTSDEPRIIQATKPTAVVAKAAASSPVPFTSQRAEPRVPVSELWSPASRAPSARDEAAVSNSKDSRTPKRILFTRVLTLAAIVAIAARLAGMPVRLLP